MQTNLNKKKILIITGSVLLLTGTAVGGYYAKQHFYPDNKTGVAVPEAQTDGGAVPPVPVDPAIVSDPAPISVTEDPQKPTSDPSDQQNTPNSDDAEPIQDPNGQETIATEEFETVDSNSLDKAPMGKIRVRIDLGDGEVKDYLIDSAHLDDEKLFNDFLGKVGLDPKHVDGSHIKHPTTEETIGMMFKKSEKYNNW